MCEQWAAMTLTFPLRVRNATSCRPRIRLETGFDNSRAWQNKYHEAGCAGKLLAGGGIMKLPALTESRLLMRLLIDKAGLPPVWTAR
jgi:hypothetical protein